MPARGHRRRSPLHLFASRSEAPAHTGRSAGTFVQRLFRLVGAPAAASHRQRCAGTAWAAADCGERRITQPRSSVSTARASRRARCSTCLCGSPAPIVTTGPMPMKDATRRVLMDGLRGAATYGSASELAARNICGAGENRDCADGWRIGAGRGGRARARRQARSRGIVVVAPGAAGRDAASIAADLLAGKSIARTPAASSRRVSAPTSTPIVAATLRVGVTGRRRQDTCRDTGARGVRGARPRRRRAAACRGRRSGGAGDRHSHLCARQSQSPPPRRVRRVRHHTLPGAAPRDTQRLRAQQQATAGRVLTYQNQPASVFYSAWCGGRSELASQVWPGAMDFAFEPAQIDDACRDEPGWTTRDFGGRHRASPAGCRSARGSPPPASRCRRNASGRVTRLHAEGFTPRGGGRATTFAWRSAEWRVGAPEEHHVRDAAHVDRLCVHRPGVRSWRRVCA